jgi:ribosomal protein S9
VAGFKPALGKVTVNGKRHAGLFRTAVLQMLLSALHGCWRYEFDVMATVSGGGLFSCWAQCVMVFLVPIVTSPFAAR